MSLDLKYLRRIFAAYVFASGNSNLAFWHSPLRVNALGREDIDGMRAYPQNFEDKIGLIETKDEKGVILLDYKGDLGLQYNPNAVAQLALGYYDKILGGEDRRAEFLTQASFFLEHFRMVEDGVLLWEYDFPFQMRNPLTAPWRSALAQGQGISVCLRAYEIGGDERYLDYAQKAFRSFRYPAREHSGGVLDDWNDRVWLEEYIVTPPNHVLNGFIWALWGVRDYAAYFNDRDARNLWKNCLATLHEHLPKYDVGLWTCYDIAGPGRPTMPCSVYYQRLHITQMEAMYNLTGDDVFDYHRRRWAGQLANPLKKAVSQIWKAYFKIRHF